MTDTIWINESPVDLTEGDQPTYSITFDDATTVASGSLAIYKNGSGSDISVTNSMTNGSFAYSGNVVTLPTLKNLVGGNRYVVAITITVDSVVEVRKLELVVQKKKDLQ